MIRSKGEAGTGNIVEAVRHMREITDGIKHLSTLRPEQLAGAAKELASPLDVVQEVAGSGWLPVPLFCAGRHRDPRRRGADDAARRRGQLRRLGHLQERRPRAPRPGDRRGDHPLRGPRARRPGLDGAGRRDARPRDRGPRRRRRPAADAVALERSGSSRSRATSRRTDRCSNRSAPRRARCARPSSCEGLDGLVIPGGESTTISKGMARDGLDEAMRAHAAAGRPILGSCAGMIVCDRDHLGIGDYRCRRNAFGRQLQSFEQDLRDRGPRATSRCAPSSSARPGSRRPGAASRCSPRSTAIRSRSATATCSPSPSTPS